MRGRTTASVADALRSGFLTFCCLYRWCSSLSLSLSVSVLYFFACFCSVLLSFLHLGLCCYLFASVSVFYVSAYLCVFLYFGSLVSVSYIFLICLSFLSLSLSPFSSLACAPLLSLSCFLSPAFFLLPSVSCFVFLNSLPHVVYSCWG